MQKKRIRTSREIGEKIKNRRRELKVSQEELAEVAGVTYQQIQRYEKGTNRLNVENIQTIADALSVPLIYFFEPDRAVVVSEEPAPYLPAEEIRLLRYFRRIKDRNSKETVIQVARLAAR